ncbi:MFS transporter [Sphaerimonospora sp. CA-214678]|uniref:MFS transporter n=1 Tax=Sphaerimonospora sp. CA-214678 TaxID=3240029 RepID=UPI003D93DD34
MAVEPWKTARPASDEPDAEASLRTWILPVLLVMVSAAVSQGFVRFTFSYVLPGMTEDVLGSYSLAGLFSAANLGGYLVGVIAVTSVARRVEGTRLLKAGLTLTVIGLSTVAVAPWVPVLFLGMGLAGLCSAAVWIPIPAIVAAHVPRRHRGFAFGLVTAGSGAGLAITGPMVTVVQRVFGADAWRPVWGLEVAISLVILTLQLLFLRPGRTHPVGEERPRRRAPLRAVLPGVHTLLIAYFLYGVSFSLYTNYLVAALRENLGFAPAAATGVFSLLGLASLFGGVLGGRVSDVCGRRGTLAVMMILAGLLAVVIPMGWGGVLHLSAFAYGLVMMGIGTVVVAYLGDVLGPRDLGAAFGVATMSLGLAQLAAPPLGGWLADRTGSFDIVFHVACGTGILAGVAVCFLPGTGRAASRRRAARSTAA